MGIRIVFLDVDGILNNNNTRVTASGGWCFVDDELVERVGRLVRETSAYVVLSSTWRWEWNINNPVENGKDFIELRDKLSQYGIELFDKTPILHGAPRGKEIEKWLKDNESLNIDNFIILDDFYDMEPFNSHLLHIDSVTGITDDDVEIGICYLTAPNEVYDLTNINYFSYWEQIACFGNWRCNKCREDFIFSNASRKKFKYCPSCGRHMVEHIDYINLNF